MNLPKRVLGNAGTALCAALLCCTAVSAPAMSRANRAHAHPVAQEQEPAPSRSHNHKASAKVSSKAAARPAAKASTRPAAKRGKHSAREEADDYAPVMKRASSRGRKDDRAKGPHRGEALVETRVERHVAHVAVAKAEPKPVAKPKPAQVTAALDAAADKAAAEKKTLTTDDFLRAANGAPPTDTPATGTSHPDEMDETAPLLPSPAVAKKALVTAAVSANDTPKVPATSARVDGFGAEGAPAPHRTIAATLAARRNKPVPPPVITAEERNEITEEAVKPMVLPAIYSKGGRLIMPAPLKGSHEVLVHQNLMADNEGLDRIQDDDDLNHLVAIHQLVRYPETATLRVNGDLPENRRYGRPWAVRFATDMAKAYSDHFHEPMQVNSAVRTVNYQLRLMRVNGNAAAVDGDTASPHLTGQALDFAKRGMSKAELAWVRTYLLPLMQAGKIDVEEEFQQACFHISVYRSYLPKTKKVVKTEVAAVRHDDEDAPSLR